jgi:hypothetical protein
MWNMAGIQLHASVDLHGSMEHLPIKNIGK